MEYRHGPDQPRRHTDARVGLRLPRPCDRRGRPRHRRLRSRRRRSTRWPSSCSCTGSRWPSPSERGLDPDHPRTSPARSCSLDRDGRSEPMNTSRFTRRPRPAAASIARVVASACTFGSSADTRDGGRNGRARRARQHHACGRHQSPSYQPGHQASRRGLHRRCNPNADVRVRDLRLRHLHPDAADRRSPPATRPTCSRCSARGCAATPTSSRSVPDDVSIARRTPRTTFFAAPIGGYMCDDDAVRPPAGVRTSSTAPRW